MFLRLTFKLIKQVFFFFAIQGFGQYLKWWSRHGHAAFEVRSEQQKWESRRCVEQLINDTGNHILNSLCTLHVNESIRFNMIGPLWIRHIVIIMVAEGGYVFNRSEVIKRRDQVVSIWAVVNKKWDPRVSSWTSGRSPECIQLQS